MATYSISDLERLSGIKAHTIRIWEQRYGILAPRRNEANVRYYEEEDLQLLFHIALLNRHGFKISKIASMSPKEVAEEVSLISEVKMGLDAKFDVLTLAVMEMDEYKFAHIFDNHVGQTGFERAMIEVIFPFLEKMTLLLLTRSIKPVQQKFFIQIVRNRLIAAIENESLPANRETLKALLYLPQKVEEELRLLFVQYICRKRKLQAVNIGYDTGLTDLKDALQIHKPDFIFTILSETFTEEPVQRYLEKLSEAAPDSRLLLTGYLSEAEFVKLPANTNAFSKMEEVIEFFERLNSSG